MFRAFAAAAVSTILIMGAAEFSGDLDRAHMQRAKQADIRTMTTR
jgi:hypothetical protein